MPDFSVHFDLEPFEALDQLALLAMQDYNLGNTGDWFGEFRGGLYGFYSRLHGVQQHYFDVHAWLPRIRTPADTEYHLASIMFHMDSALECFTFALNAFGWAVMPSNFRNITDAKILKQISPFDIIGNPTRNPPMIAMAGYAQIFPAHQAEWQAKAQLITHICELHDVSKHRRTIYVGGQHRLDPPDGFYEALRISDGAVPRTLLSPMAEIILKHDPKSPSVQRKTHTVRQNDLLEELVPSFAALINISGAAVFEDAKTKVCFKEKSFRKA